MSLPPSTVPAETRLGRTALRVGDLEETIDFYREVVGLTVEARDGEAVTLGVVGAPLLVLIGDECADPRDSRETGLYHNAFRFPSRAALGDALRRVRDRGTLTGASDHGFSEALYLDDPEGNGVELYRDRPRSAWPFDDDGTLRADSPRPLDLGDLAADANSEPMAPPETAVGHVHLEVSSIEATREFYAETVGFDVTMSLGRSAVFFAAGDYHHHIGVNTWHGRTEPAAGRGLAWFEVVVPGAASVAAVRRRLGDSGSSVTAVDGGIEVTDPSGIAVRFRTPR